MIDLLVLKQRIFSAVIDTSPLPTTPADDNRVQIILSLIFVIIGAISLLMVTIGGFRYVVSHGDPSNIAQAKNTILYSIIGLVVAIAGVGIVNFVVGYF